MIRIHVYIFSYLNTDRAATNSGHMILWVSTFAVRQEMNEALNYII